jgi:hypothetical protein
LRADRLDDAVRCGQRHHGGSQRGGTEQPEPNSCAANGPATGCGTRSPCSAAPTQGLGWADRAVLAARIQQLPRALRCHRLIVPATIRMASASSTSMDRSGRFTVQALANRWGWTARRSGKTVRAAVNCGQP